MKKIFLVLLISVILVFSGCSSLSNNSKIGAAKIDNTGNGLEINFNLDKTDILSKKIYYSLDLINSGRAPIKLNRDNFKLTTIETQNSGTGYAFTQQSLDSFYSNIFKNPAPLFQNEKREGIIGTLIIEDYWFNNLNKNQINYNLDVNYDYSTNFTNNVELDLNSRNSNKFKLIDSLSQAAPVKLDSIKLKPDIRNDEYILVFNFVDSGMFSQTKAKFKNINLNFRGQKLTNCKYFTDFNGNSKEVSFQNFILGSKNKNLEVKCQTFISGFDTKNKLTTQVSGDILYNYFISMSGIIDLPKNRISKPIFN